MELSAPSLSSSHMMTDTSTDKQDPPPYFKASQMYPPQTVEDQQQSQQTAYQLDDPPPYFSGPTQSASSSQQDQNNGSVHVVPDHHQPPQHSVVLEQPTAVQRSLPGEGNRAKIAQGFIFSLTVVLIMIFALFGCWWALICLIPAGYYSGKAANEVRLARGSTKASKRYIKLSLGWNIAGIVSVLIGIVILITVLFVVYS